MGYDDHNLRSHDMTAEIVLRLETKADAVTLCHTVKASNIAFKADLDVHGELSQEMGKERLILRNLECHECVN